jgi:hypothetical protein
MQKHTASTFRAEARWVRDLMGYTGLCQESGKEPWPIRATGLAWYLNPPHFSSEDGGSIFPQNVGIDYPHWHCNENLKSYKYSSDHNRRRKRLFQTYSLTHSYKFQFYLHITHLNYQKYIQQLKIHSRLINSSTFLWLTVKKTIDCVTHLKWLIH